MSSLALILMRLMNQIKITRAHPEDLLLIKNNAEKMDLDVSNMNPENILVAKIKNELAGFGRLKPHYDAMEIGTFGVIPKFRNGGIGKIILNKLIKIGGPEIYLVTHIPSFCLQYRFKVVTQNIPESIIKAKEKSLKDYPNYKIYVLKLIQEF